MSADLMKAVSSKDEAKILEIISQPGVRLDDTDPHGNTPLNYACAMGLSEDVILKMISLGASCKIANKNGAMPLNHAVYSKLSSKVLKAIVESGGDVNYQNESGGTALQVACICKAGLAAVECLVDELKADLDLANHNGNTPLMFAIRNHNDLDVVTYLSKKVKDINAKTSKDDSKYPGFTALHFAAGEHLPAHAAVLITNGALTDVQNEEGYTPLQLADEKTKIAMMSSSFAKFNMSSGTPSPSDSPGPHTSAQRRSTMQAEDISRSSVKRSGPLRRTSMLASLPASGSPAASLIPEPAITENDDLDD